LDDSRTSLGKNDTCFGCKTPHPWMNKNKVIVCLNRDKPGVRKEAARAYAAGLKNYKKKQESRSNKRKVNHDKMSNANKECMKEAVFASMGIRTNCNKPSTGLPSLPSKKPLIFVIDVPVLSSLTASHAIMPTLIMFNFLHICLQLGSTLDCARCHVLRCVVDMAAAFTTGNFHFVAPLAKKYPHCLAKLYVPEDYNPIILSGISHDGTFCGTSVLQDPQWSGHQYSHCHWSPRHS
jgi:hypothetical protein